MKEHTLNWNSRTALNNVARQSPPNVPLSSQVAVRQPAEATVRAQILLHQHQPNGSTVAGVVGMVGPTGSTLAGAESHHNRWPHHQHPHNAGTRLVSAPKQQQQKRKHCN